MEQFDKKEREALFTHFPDGLVVFDLETTGLSPLMDKIIEISALKITPSSIEVFDELVNPECEILAESTAIHGLNNDHVKDAPTIKEILPKFFNFANELPLLAHNAQFDAGFLVFEQHQRNESLPKQHVYCSLKMARTSFPQFPSYKLISLTTELKIELNSHHHALDDSLAALRVFMKSLLRLHPQVKEAKIFNLNDFNKSIDLEVPKKLKLLKNEIFHQTILDIMYSGGTHKGVFRPIKPISILPMPKGAILYAHCLLSNHFKSFALKKVVDVRLCEDQNIIDKYGKKP